MELRTDSFDVELHALPRHRFFLRMLNKRDQGRGKKSVDSNNNLYSSPVRDVREVRWFEVQGRVSMLLNARSQTMVTEVVV